MMKKLILCISLICSTLFADGDKERKHFSYDVSLALLKSIHDDAIILGSGKKLLYAFIDPLCPHSKKFISMVFKNPEMLSNYQYHLFLYSIPRLKSTDVVSAIYQSLSPIETLLKIMIEEKVDSEKSNETTKARVDRITTVAQKINVYKRPYIFIIK